VAKHEVCKSGKFDLRVDFCHLDPKSRANHFEHFGTLNVTSLGLGIAKNKREGYTLEKQEVYKSGMFDLRVDFWHLDPESRANRLGHGIAKNQRGCCTLSLGSFGERWLSVG